MVIGSVDVAVTMNNVKRSKKRRREVLLQAEPSSSYDTGSDLGCDASMPATHFNSDSSKTLDQPIVPLKMNGKVYHQGAM